MKVYKFGGASVRNADGVRNLANITAGESGRLFVIVSAMGKMTNALEGVLDMFYAGQRDGAMSRLVAVTDYHDGIISDLWATKGYEGKARELYAELENIIMHEKPESRNYEYWYDLIVSYGELLSTTIVSEYLNGIGQENLWVDMRRYFITAGRHRDANIELEESASRLRPVIDAAPQRLFIGQGFIGTNADGETTTIGREGSDYSAAVAGYILDAASVAIWKDVEGILNGDPKIFSDTTYIPEMTYLDAIELAFSGAQVIHPKTIKPLQNKNIPLHVKCFMDASAPGSIIKDEAAKIEVPILILKPNQVLFTIRPEDFSFVLEERFAQIFAMLAEYNIKVNLVQNSAVSLSLCMDASRYLDDVAAKLKSEGFNVLYNTGMELLTIRGYTPRELELYAEDDSVYLSQRTRRNIRIVRRKAE